MTPQFIHLRVHSEFSIVDGIVRVKSLIAELAKQDIPAVAITDQINLFATVKFYGAATAKGVKPLIGCDLFVENSDISQPPYLLPVLCQNTQGYKNLTRLVTRAYRENQGKYGALIKRQWLAEAHAGLIALSGAEQGDVGQALLANNLQLAEQLLHYWQDLMPDRYYIELQRTGQTEQQRYIDLILPIAQQRQLPVVATNNVRFIAREDYEAHEARVCIHSGYTLNDPKRPKLTTTQQYLKTPAEMAELFADIPEALQNTVQIAKRCNLNLQLGESFLPTYPIPKNQAAAEYLAEQSQIGLIKRLKIIFDCEEPQQNPEFETYYQRLQTELNVINSMGFAGYFLIVADFIAWSKEHDIPVGPGRGSGAGSLVAYSLGITELDPLQYALLFERFLNPERLSMPDFDIDFCMEGRDQVIEYVAQKYGRDSVSQIITYGTMAAKAVVRDVGRVLSHPYGFVDKLAKLIPFELGITLDKALQQEEELRQRYQQEEEVRLLIDLARKLEGITRNAGKHAGGVVIAPSVLTDHVPLYCEPDGENLVTQYDKDDVEAVGLVKFDFLGLRTLTIIKWALRNINQQRQQNHLEPLDISRISLQDEKTFVLLKTCHTTAVFQLESRGMKDLIKRLQPDCFEEIVALVALYRPGPLQSGMVDDFIARKHGQAAVEYFHPDLEAILRSTYGVILYQEQVMQIPQLLAGYTLGGADILRRAMGKKKPEEMAKQRSVFIEGAKERGVEEKLASHIFDLMEKFSGYGFNKSHSAAYALLSYQTAWLKAHYPAAFMAAVLSSDMDNTDKVVSFIVDSRSFGLVILPPHINHSHYQFTVQDDKTILYGLGAVKGVGEAAVESIVAARQNAGAFSSLFDFCQRIDLRKVNRRALESLIKAGALDELGADRATLMQSIASALRFAEKTSQDLAWGQHDLFADEVQLTMAPAITYSPALPWSDEQRLLGERETLGFYLTGHPLDRYQQEFAKFTHGLIVSLQADSYKSQIIAGVIKSVRTLMTKRGKRMAIISLEDQTSSVDVMLFSEAYDAAKANLVKDAVLIVEGTVDHDDFSGRLRVRGDKVYNLTTIRERFVKCLWLRITKQQATTGIIEQLKIQLQTYQRGQCKVCIEYIEGGADAHLTLSREWWVEPTDVVLQGVQHTVGTAQAEFVY